MSISDFERLLAAALPSRGPLAITLTDCPDGDDLIELIDRAMLAGDSHGAPLVEIHAPLARYSFINESWRHATIRDSDSVVRMVFEAPLEAAA